MLDGMSDSIQGSRIEDLQSREVDRQSPTGLILCIHLCFFDLFVCPHPFMFPWAVDSSPLQFLALE